MINHYNKKLKSKNILNNKDNKIPLYYQDTDSIHLPTNKVNKLSQLFKKKYKRELIGEQTGQFHTDFELEGATDIYAEKSIFLDSSNILILNFY